MASFKPESSFAMITALYQYLIQIKNGESEIDHLWVHRIGKLLPTFFMWYDTEDYSKANRNARILNATFIASISLLWCIVMIRMCTDFPLLPASRISESLSTVIGGYIAFYCFASMCVNRNQLTEIIKVVDEKIFAVPNETPLQREWWVYTRKVHVFEGYFLLLALTMGLLLGVSHIIFMCYTGSLFYDTIWVPNESYSFSWWTQAMFQGLVLTYSGVFFSAKDFILADLFYTITRLIRFQAATIMELDQKKRPEEQYQELSNCLRETIELYRWAILKIAIKRKSQ